MSAYQRIRAAGAGIGGFFTPTGYGTDLAQGKEVRELDGRMPVVETPIHADFAFIKAERGNRWGNLTYRMTARNFGPVMAMAANITIATVHEVVELGALDPEAVVTPGLFVRRLVKIARAHRGRIPMIKWSRDQMAARVAADIAEGMVVNLGIGLPTLVANHLGAGKEVMLHSENGIIGMGPAPPAGQENHDLINAGKQPVTLLPGGVFFHHADSLAMMRGGHIDICVLGASQVAANGDLANWSTGEPDAIPAVGGAMELATGAKKTWVMMEHVTKNGAPKIVPRCTYPLTGLACVSRFYTDLAVLDIAPAGVRVRERAKGADFAAPQACTGVPLIC